MSISYEQAGVSIEGGDLWVETIKGLIKKRALKNTAGVVGGFSGLYPISGNQYLAACCDGVGTKLEIARMAQKYRGLGQDLVAMNVNDLVTCGATPLFFLDYIACGSLQVGPLTEIMHGILDGCELAECALLGGETAEMPGVYAQSAFDLAGFSVGLVEKKDIIDGSRIQDGDLLVGLPSSGIHSNGYSLVRKALLEGEKTLSLEAIYPGTEAALGDILLEPTKIYVKAALAAKKSGLVKGMAHITGGGLEGNIARVLPRNLSLQIDYTSWQACPIFDLLERSGIESAEMRKVFNIGIGFVLIVSASDVEQLLDVLKQAGEIPSIIGSVRA